MAADLGTMKDVQVALTPFGIGFTSSCRPQGGSHRGFGDIRSGATEEDTYAAVQSVVAELVQMGIIPSSSEAGTT